jgi:hypothetical protein
MGYHITPHCGARFDIGQKSSVRKHKVAALAERAATFDAKRKSDQKQLNSLRSPKMAAATALRQPVEIHCDNRTRERTIEPHRPLQPGGG